MNHFFLDSDLLKSILITAILAFANYSIAQITVTGKVISSEDQSPLPGINVIEKGTTNGTVSDIDGNFSIICTDENAIIQLSFIGLLNEEVEVTAGDLGIISMSSDVAQLSQTICCMCVFYCQMTKIGYNTGLNYNKKGIRVSTMTPFIRGKSVFIRSDFTYRFDNENSSLLSIELARYELINIRSVGIDIMAGYSRIKLPDGNRPIITQKIVSPEISYRGYKLISGVIRQKIEEQEKSTQDYGVVLGLSKRIASQLHLGFRTMYVMDQWQYGVSITEGF